MSAVRSTRTNYASVVSGLGGAFHHPSQVLVRPRIPSERREQNAPRCSWPGGGASESAIGKQLLRPRKLFQAGAVGVIGIAIAMLTYPRESNVLDLPFHLATTPWSRDSQLAHFLSVLTVALTIVRTDRKCASCEGATDSVAVSHPWRVVVDPMARWQSSQSVGRLDHGADLAARYRELDRRHLRAAAL